MAYRQRFRRFGHTAAPRTAITSSQVVVKRKTKCKACNGEISIGQVAVKVRLKKSYRLPCTSCGHKPVGAKRFHPNCVPSDLNQAMGYDPSKHVHNAPPASRAAAVPPPPKPPSASEAAVAALAALENALVLKVRDNPRAMTPELEKAFNRLQGIKARVVRPGTPAEGEVATSLALQQLVKMVFV